MNEQLKDKRTASQRIEDLERTIMALYQTCDNMARDLMTVKEAIKLLGNKSEAIAKASNLSDETISALMVANNVAELKGKVTNLIEQGILQASEQITDSSFVVGQEVDADGTVVNPRIQFSLGSLNPELQAKIKAGKIGDAIVLQEGKLSFLITEAYAIVAPKAPEAASVQDTPAVATEIPTTPVSYAPPVAMPADALPASQSSSDTQTAQNS